jgi:hypothetical protein
MRIVCSLRRAGLGAAVLAGVLDGPATIQSQAQSSSTMFSGQATAVKGTVVGVPVTLVDTGSIAPQGGTIENHLLCYPAGPNCAVSIPDATNGALSVDVLSAAVVAQGDKSRATASVADLSVNALGHQISASFIQARAAAQCANGQATVTATSEIADLVIDTVTIAVTGGVKQTVNVGPVTAVINDQTPTMQGGTGDVTVTALHITIPDITGVGGTDLYIAQAHADIQCGLQSCPADKDFVTGGGWLANPTRNFAVAGGIKNGGYWGHLLYIDHGTGMKVKGTGVTAYVVPVTGATTRHIEGTCEVNGAPGYTYQVDVDDVAEPGKGADSFTMTLNKTTPVASDLLAGGNIQLHTCK